MLQAYTQKYLEENGYISDANLILVANVSSFDTSKPLATIFLLPIFELSKIMIFFAPNLLHIYFRSDIFLSLN